MKPLSPDIAASIELLILDVDGVLTDGRLWFDADGEALKVFNVRDGHGIKRLREAGVEVAIISGRDSAAVAARMRELGVRHVVQGAGDKQAALDALLAALGIAPERTACLVDDLPDLPLVRGVGLPAAVADADAAVLAEVGHVTARPGGAGAVREFCDWLLAARGARG